jgi:hypothetical protein
MESMDKNCIGEDRGERLLAAIYDDVDQRLNPSGDDCGHCGGEGYTYDCIDGCCANAEFGCATCERRCPECALFAGQRAKAVREAVIETNDIDISIAWLKIEGRWHDGISRDQVRDELQQMRAKLNKTEATP